MCNLFSILLLIVFTTSASALALPEYQNINSFINYVNSAQKLWIAGHQLIPKEKVQRNLMDLKFLVPHRHENVMVKQLNVPDLPDHFDAREKWSKCESIGNIRDQSDCGSCWAVSAAETISDRTCIHSNSTVNVILSAEDLLSCCTSCGYGCEGGYYNQAWKWWIEQGLVTGGSFESQYGCQPYSISPCGFDKWPSCSQRIVTTPQCKLQCTSKRGYETAYLQDKNFGAKAYFISNRVDQIQAEILTNGPVQVGFTVYEDFYHYKSGVYKHTAGGPLGGHAVKIIGWGQENGTPYWLVANSWNTLWGEKGYFKIVRGTNDCGIEDAPMAGLPDLERHN
uniref:Pept_C1 domain-containing protein n=1 Tax=Caenorhabditis japonica TaxID=281687 RepID=A0A8R1DZE2_CAEJA